MAESYQEFFGRITTKKPLPYQERVAAEAFTPTLLVVPTGLGKTDAVLMPWLYAKAQGTASPTRLAYVLPRQNLTQQTADVARRRVEKAELDIDVLELICAATRGARRVGLSISRCTTRTASSCSMRFN